MPRLVTANILLVVGVLVLANSVVAEDKNEWLPPEPSPKSKDWLRTTSGEWLRGELKSIRDQDVEFDSDEMDLVKLDLEDVAEIRSPRILTWGFEHKVVATGTATMKGDVIRIRVGEEILQFSRRDLLSVIEGDLSEWNLWSLKASVGLVGRSGNTDQVDFNSDALLRRETTRTRLDFDYKGNSGEVNGERTVNSHNIDTGIEILVSRGFFVTPATVSLYTDRFQNIALRATVGLGLGYYVVRNGDLEWKVDLVAGYQSTRFNSVLPGEEETVGSWNLNPGTKLEWDVTGDIDLDFDYSVRFDIPDVKNAFHNFTVKFAIEIYGALDFDVSGTWDRVESPTRNAEGVVPERDDLRITFGIGVDI